MTDTACPTCRPAGPPPDRTRVDIGPGDGRLAVLPPCGCSTCRPAAPTPSTPATASGSCCRWPAPARSPPTASRFELRGRESVFTGVTDFAYLPRDTRATDHLRRGRPLRPGRRDAASADCRPATAPPPAVPVELRGTGSCSRQVNNFAAADVFECDRLIAVEVLTPGGNWSSYPPHKHDEHRARRGVRAGGDLLLRDRRRPGTAGLGYQRVSPSGHGAAPTCWPRSAAATPC